MDIIEERKRRQARVRRRIYLKDPVNRELDKERSRKRYADIKKRKADLEFILGRQITVSEFYRRFAKPEKISV